MGMLAQAECRAFLGHRHGDEPSNVFQATLPRRWSKNALHYVDCSRIPENGILGKIDVRSLKYAQFCA